VRRSSCLLALLALVAAGDAARGAADAVRVPAGFRVEVYARGLERPTALAWGPGGSLYATQEGGTVVRVKPRKTIARGFATPLGLAWDDGTLFVSAQGALWRVRGGGRRAIVSKLPFGRHQQDNVVLRSGRLYFGSGSTCDVCQETSRLSAAVLSVRPDGGDLRVVSRGLRNPFGHGRKLTRVVLRPGRPGAVSTFATGFDHPIAVTVDPLGALLVADYGRGVVYRIQARGKR
jgi:glucose/arabinose dehydrogenase